MSRDDYDVPVAHADHHERLVRVRDDYGGSDTFSPGQARVYAGRLLRAARELDGLPDMCQPREATSAPESSETRRWKSTT